MDPFDAHFQDPGDLLSEYMDSGSKLQSPINAEDDDGAGAKNAWPGHRRSNSADASSSMLSEGIEAKKAMSPDKLAELWNVDPKRAKRFSLLSSFLLHCTALLLLFLVFEIRIRVFIWKS